MGVCGQSLGGKAHDCLTSTWGIWESPQEEVSSKPRPTAAPWLGCTVNGAPIRLWQPGLRESAEGLSRGGKARVAPNSYGAKSVI